jgi:hypothetical protein
LEAEAFHARSLAALERTRGLRDDAFLKLIHTLAIRPTVGMGSVVEKLV